MTGRLDIDWVRAYVEGRLASSERAAFARRLEAEPELAESVERYTEVAAWPVETVPTSAVRFEDLALEAPRPAGSVHRLTPRHVAVAAGVLIAFVGGYFALTQRSPSAPDPSGPIVLAAIEAPGPALDAGTVPAAASTLAESYEPVLDRHVRFVEGIEDARRIATLARRPIVVFVHLDGCPACAEMDRTTFRDDRVLSLAPGFVFAKVSATVVDATLALPAELGLGELRDWPTYAIFDAGGVRLDVFGGIMDAAKFASRLSEAAGKTASGVPAWQKVHESARVARLGAEAGAALGAASRLASIGRVDEAISELDRAIVVVAGLPHEGDLRHVRERLAGDRKFPVLEYAR